MTHRILGKTGYKVSCVGLGGIPIQRIESNGVPAIIDEMLRHEMNFIDTAVAYTVSEKYLGEALKGRRDQFIIATKSPARNYDEMKKDIEKSLTDLQTDHIELYQCHNVSKDEEYIKVIDKDNGALKALLEAKEEGKIGAIGITSHSCDLLEKYIDEMPFETIQFPYNIVENQAENLFKRAHDKNIGVIVMKPIAGGAIDNGELSIKYILNNPHVSVVIPGMESPELVRKNAIAQNSYKLLTSEEINEINDIKASLTDEFCRRCMYCMPCPQKINIPAQFIIEGYYKRYQLEGWGRMRYDNQETNASDCIECGICETKCPYNLPIRKMLKTVVQTFE